MEGAGYADGVCCSALAVAEEGCVSCAGFAGAVFDVGSKEDVDEEEEEDEEAEDKIEDCECRRRPS